MNELTVVTFKRPADNFDKKFFGDDLEYVYDCGAYSSTEIAELEIKKMKHKYEEVKSFVCSKDDYMNWMDDGVAYKEFARTGVPPVKTISEDVDVGTDHHTESLHLILEMRRNNDISEFDYSVDIDEAGQIVFTPKSTDASFTDIRRAAGYDSTSDVVEENLKRFSVDLSADMISESGNFDWFVDIDEIGQAIVTPDLEDTSFLTVSVEDSLNLITERVDSSMGDEEPSLEDVDCPVPDYSALVGKSCEFLSKHTGQYERGMIKRYEGCSGDPMDDFVGCDSSYEHFTVEHEDGTLENVDVQNVFCECVRGKNMKVLKESNKYRDFDWDRKELYAVIKNDGSYAGAPCLSYEEAQQLSYHPGSKIFKLVLEDDPGEEPLEESLSDVDRMSIVDKVMRGEVNVFSGEGEPDPSYSLIPELSNNQGKVSFEYYYDEESGDVVSYARLVNDVE